MQWSFISWFMWSENFRMISNVFWSHFVMQSSLFIGKLRDNFKEMRPLNALFSKLIENSASYASSKCLIWKINSKIQRRVLSNASKNAYGTDFFEILCEHRVPYGDQKCQLWWPKKTSGKRSKKLLKIFKNYFWKITQILISSESIWFVCNEVPTNELHSGKQTKSSFSKNWKFLIVFTLGNHRPHLGNKIQDSQKLHLVHIESLSSQPVRMLLGSDVCDVSS